jgi:YD repeat-containing protein
VEILNDSNSAIAEFAYDALGRRIEKKDLIARTSIRYYNNN